jgi:hypothetical protein
MGGRCKSVTTLKAPMPELIAYVLDSNCIDKQRWSSTASCPFLDAVSSERFSFHHCLMGWTVDHLTSM